MKCRRDHPEVERGCPVIRRIKICLYIFIKISIIKGVATEASKRAGSSREGRLEFFEYADWDNFRSSHL